MTRSTPACGPSPKPACRQTGLWPCADAAALAQAPGNRQVSKKLVRIKMDVDYQIQAGMVWQSVFFGAVVGRGPGDVCAQFAGGVEWEIGFAKELPCQYHQVGLTTGNDVF